MKNSQVFEAALAEGKCIIRRVWANAKNPEQVTIQFQQEFERPNEGGNLLVALAQGIEGNLKNRPTALWSFKRSVVEAKGIALGDYFDTDKVITGKDVFGVDVAIRVIENTTQNPKAPNQQPKRNATTNEVLTYDGNPIYMHTDLVEGTEPVLKLMQSNGTISSLDWAAEKSVKHEVGQEVPVEAEEGF